MKKWKNWFSVWFGFMMNVLVNPGVMMKQQGCKVAAVDVGFFQTVRGRQQEKLAEENKKKRRIERKFQESLMMLYEKTTREARAGPLLPLQKS
ncbi:hypothetical protein BK049_09650 [Bacillus xiamenensis]|uniref:Uncharacterized protein n=1 Tax=Bacillus xiamenensis TaxID=1178537 RepID=A0AAC9IFZ2_9BACI|nr:MULTISPECIES: hypothetical protein [Bacillus]AOZ88920.1 hypothetical protein BK049_09650 [Bacillus xiamenensis]EKF34862.1 hypothetical protein BA1_13021 [Bacillus xiamenensis]MBG9910220.1 hypothetical protein [Bacillus xiamenensis]MCY9575148.1 hypothetical protein [Bacillus xiamenensis]QGX64358.1 hypothetical protein GPA07_02420 [Bacillus sp. ms-22]